MDRESLLSSFEGDTELLREIIDVFLEDCPKQLAAIRGGMDRQDFATVERSAHALKGSVSNFGAPEAVHAALKLELMGREGDLSQSEAAYELLQTELHSLQVDLAAFEEEAVS